MPLNRDVSCSSVHESDKIGTLTTSCFIGVCTGSASCSTISPDRVEVALDERRGFFFGAIVYQLTELICRTLEAIRFYSPVLQRGNTNARRER